MTPLYQGSTVQRINSWCEELLMPLNYAKWRVVTVIRKNSQFLYCIPLTNVSINSTSSHKYLSVQLTSNLPWTKDIKSISPGAPHTPRYLTGCLKLAPPHLHFTGIQGICSPKTSIRCSFLEPLSTMPYHSPGSHTNPCCTLHHLLSVMAST